MEGRKAWRIKPEGGVPPWGGSYTSEGDNFETGTFWSLTLPQKGPNPGECCAWHKADNQPAQNKKTLTKEDSPDKRFQYGSRTRHSYSKGWHHTSPKSNFSRYPNCNRIAQRNLWQIGGKKWHGKLTWDSRGWWSNRYGLYPRNKGNTTEPGEH